MNISTPDNNLIISRINIDFTFLKNKRKLKFSTEINRTDSSCSLTNRNFLTLPRSDRARDGVDIGVRLPG